MSHTTVTFKDSTQQRIDMRWLSKLCKAQNEDESIDNLSILVGKEKVSIRDLFKITGKIPNEKIVLENPTTKMDYVGHELTKGLRLTVTGNIGHFAGTVLSGGTLKVEGDVCDFAGCGMKKGLIDISGNGGDYIGGAPVGEKKGMSGGTILIHGNAANFTGDLMRRGLIMVVGNIGNYCGSRMIAGTITNLGGIGKQAGVGMRRGTLLLPHKPKDVITGFHDCGRHSLGYLTLLMHELRRHHSAFRSLHPMRRRVQRYIGDAAVDGQGEMLVWIG